MNRTLPIPWLLSAALLVAAAAPARSQEVPKQVEELAEKALKSLEIKPLDRIPDWYDPEAKPLFTFVQITDIHLSKKNEKRLLAALDYVNRNVKPVFTAITGDNAGHSSIEAQQHLKSLLEKNLESPWFIVRGDNWARNFAAVFGSTRFAFECGGIRFVFSGLDRDQEGAGIGVFEEDTWEWMRRELSPESPMSVVFLMHENIQPPVFLDAPKLDALLEKSPCAAATFTGHLHMDLEFKAGRVPHILSLSLTQHERGGFKVCETHEKHVAVRTVEWDGEKFSPSMKFQRFELPHPASSSGPDPIRNFRALPGRETVFDVSARENSLGLLLQLGIFAKRIGKAEEFARILKSPKREGAEENAGEEGF